MTVSRETLQALADRHALPAHVVETFYGLLSALEAEPHAPTTFRTTQEIIDGHLADSLSGLEVGRLTDALRIADIGAGAGFPGLALAAALPSARVDLLESNGKKCEVIERLAAAAGLTNVRPLALRAEEWAAGEGAGAYDAATARAVAPLAVLAEYAAPLLRVGGALVAWKGARDPREEAAGERAAEQLGMRLERVVSVRPFDSARERHLHVYSKVGPTGPRFPRRPGAARKRPLA
jgi:16S rRNA (guanine527-N7)-methyltransferase